MSFSSFKFKIVGIVTLSAFIFVFILIFFLKPNISSYLFNSEIDKIDRLLSEESLKVDQIFHKYELLSELFSRDNEVEQYLINPTDDIKAEVERNLSQYVGTKDGLDMIFILDKSGHSVFSTNKKLINQDYSSYSNFQKGIKGSDFVDVLIGKNTHEPGYYFSSPVLNASGKIIGVLAVKVGFNNISNQIREDQFIDTINTLFTDKYGVIISTYDQNNLFKSLVSLTDNLKNELEKSNRYLDQKVEPLYKNLELDSVLTEDFSSVVDSLNDSIADKFFIFKKIEDRPFFLIQLVDIATINASVISLSTIFIDIILLIIILIIGIFYILISFFLRPLDKIQRLSKKISSGDFSEKFDTKSKDEFGKLGEAFNFMIDHLGEIYKNQDKQIRERTESLRLKSEEAENQKKAIINVLEDFEIKRAENLSLINRMDLATRAGRIAVWEWNLIDDSVSWDDQMYGLFGLKKESMKSSITREFWQNMVHPDDRENREKATELALQGKKPYDLTFRIIWPNGEIHHLRAFGNVERDANGKAVKIVGVDFDVTSEKETDQAKTEFVSLASHQMKTPIGSLSWNLEMLRNGDYGKLNKGQKEVLDDMYRMNQRMNDLINSLLNISRLDMGVFIVEPEPTDWGDICDEVLRELDSRIKTKQHKISKKYDRNINRIPADPKLLRIIFQNYLSNAIKYTPDKGKIGIMIENKNNKVTISVSNNGEPIPDTDKDKIFDKLFRASNAQAQDPDGNGLGLYLVKKIIENSGGQTWFESEKGKDTVFYASFPATGMIEKKKPIKS